MEIKVLGTGCPNCKKTKAVVAATAQELDINAHVIEVTDIGDIMAYGVMSTPAVVIDGKVVSSGSVPTAKQMTQFMRAAM